MKRLKNYVKVNFQDVLMFLFDQSIVICKKDVLKKNFYVFKERMSLQAVTLVDVTDGRGKFLAF